MKKKILFCLQTMIMGGVEKELITVLKRLDPEQFAVELLLFYVEDEEIIKTIPSYVKLTVLNVDRNYWCSDAKRYILSRIKKNHLIEAFNIAVRSAISGGTSTAYINMKDLEALPEEYDTAICYHIHSAVVLRYVAERIKAKRKIVWIHNDFNVSGFKVEHYQKTLKEYDCVVAVSERLHQEFDEHCPNFSKKSITIHNVVDSDEIREKSKERTDSFFAEDDRKKIVTVGRYVEQKGYDIAIAACRILVEKGLNISWYAIGWGPEEEKMKEQVHNFHLENNFYILGKKNNPYPYIAGADLYVQPSRHEGYAVTVCEAMTLNKYIIATNFAGAKEQIVSDNMGFVVDSFEAEELATIIEDKLLCHYSNDNTLIDEWNKIVGVL